MSRYEGIVEAANQSYQDRLASIGNITEDDKNEKIVKKKAKRVWMKLQKIIDELEDAYAQGHPKATGKLFSKYDAVRVSLAKATNNLSKII